MNTIDALLEDKPERLAFLDTLFCVRAECNKDHLRQIFERFPEDLQDQILLYGFYDSVVRDAISVYLRGHPEVLSQLNTGGSND